MKIELITKLVYGQDLIYIKDEKLRETFSRNGIYLNQVRNDLIHQNRFFSLGLHLTD